MSADKPKNVDQAAALRYAPESSKAPTIIALGKGEIAKRILSKAKESNIPIYKDSSLSNVLNSMQIGDEIPPELYEVVASILVFVSELDKKYER